MSFGIETFPRRVRLSVYEVRSGLTVKEWLP
jgi:hypothetical protein